MIQHVTSRKRIIKKSNTQNKNCIHKQVISIAHWENQQMEDKTRREIKINHKEESRKSK